MIFFYTLFLALSILLQIPSLEAGGWGKQDEVLTLEGTTWNRVYFDMNGIQFTALLPNYSSGTLQNNITSLRGNIEGIGGYIIQTTLNPDFNPPKQAAKFLQMAQEANPDAQVVLIKTKKLGAKFGVDVIPTKEDKACWRFLCTENRLIKMGTDDRDPKRQALFFESIKIE